MNTSLPLEYIRQRDDTLHYLSISGHLKFSTAIVTATIVPITPVNTDLVFTPCQLGGVNRENYGVIATPPISLTQQ